MDCKQPWHFRLRAAINIVILIYLARQWQRDLTERKYGSRANLDLVRSESDLKLAGDWPIYCGESTLSRLMPDFHLRGNLISPGCVIKGHVENSVLSPVVWVGENAVVKNAVVMANVSIGRHTLVNNAILDEGSVTGEHCHVGSDKLGLTIVGQSTKIPAYSSLRPDGIPVDLRKCTADKGLAGALRFQLELDLA